MTEHTYLRYECADAFGLTVAGASSKAPPSSNNCLAAAAVVVKGTGGGSSTDGEGNNLALLLTTTGSQVTGFHVRSGEPVLKVGHRERLSGGVGTGRALNSTEVVCLAVSHRNHHRDNRSSSSSSSSNNSSSSSVKIATGWIDGAVRIFDVYDSDLQRKSSGALGTAHSLLSDVDDDDFCRREPLTLRGHGTSPVRTVAFDGAATTSAAAAGGARLASGGSDGVVILWDVVAETGLFRFTGHRGAITDVSFVALDDSKFDGLITSSLDGLVKIWDLDQQCCVQTLAGQDKVWASAARPLAASSSDSPPRWRLLTGGQDGQVRVWSVHSPVRNGAHPAAANGADKEQPAGRTGGSAATRKGAPDDVCTYMGTLVPPPNVSTSSERISCVHYHPATGRFVGVVHANAKHVHVYIVRGTEESHRKRQRRLRRRQEKKKKKAVADIDAEEKSLRGGKKRGLLDDPESSDDEEKNEAATAQDEIMDPELLKASDEFEYLTTVRCGHKVRGFTFLPGKVRGEVTRLVCALSTNALETHAVIRKKEKDTKAVVIVTAEKINTLDMVGHPTGIRSVALSSDDRLACTVSKNVTKIWNVAGRSCIQSLSLDKNKSAGYGLCAVFLPGNTHVAVGTREGHLFLLDTAAGEVVYCEEKAHKGAIWSLDLRRRPAAEDESAATQLVTGSADRTVKFWTIESQDEDEESLQPARPMAVHTRTLQMTDDVIAVRYSSGPSVKRMLFVSTLDCTIKVFFEDSLKLFLSLYGHKLPALAVDGSDDDVLLASSGGAYMYLLC
jgi:U3 small nucleolar RNA-associated protein 12